MKRPAKQPKSVTKRRKQAVKTEPTRVVAKATKSISDDAVISTLRQIGHPLPKSALIDALNLGKKSSYLLDDALSTLERSGVVVRNRRDEYCLRERIGLLVGRVGGHRDGHGFVYPEDRSDPIFLSHRQMQQVMHGDRVSVRITGHDRRGRPEGSIVDVLERGMTEVVGRLYEEFGVYFVVPENTRISHRVLIPANKLHRATQGQVVLVKLIEQPGKNAQPVGHIAQVLGEHGAPGMETDIAIYSHGLPNEFPPEVLAEAKKLGDKVKPKDKQDRIDLLEIPLVTIDGEDARDFDDAVYCEKSRNGWRLIVAIADVSHYVRLDTALDEEARKRGTSVYFPTRVLPMLPEAISNGLCSLNPKVDRLCMVCDMRVSASGEVTRAEFYDAVMCSAARLTYTSVAAFLANPSAAAGAALQPLAKPLHDLYEVFKALHQERLNRHALDFDAQEMKARFDEKGKVVAFVEQTRNDAHRLIEECMIAANVQAAKYLKRHKIPTLYRVHGSPEEDRLEQLREFLRGFAISLPLDRKLTPKDLSEIIARISNNDEAPLIQNVIMRSLPQAVYQPENIGHFGLSLTEYAHFTSPIRRYPDLLVHRGIRHVLKGGTVEDWPEAMRDMNLLGAQCSTLERRADEATRDAMSWLKCEYMQNHIGEEFDSVVTGVVEFGLFVQIKDMQIDGLIHVSSLGSDYFSRDKSGYRLIGERSKKVYRLGDHLRVRLINVVIDERKIDFELMRAPGAESDKQFSRNPFRRNRGPRRKH